MKLHLTLAAAAFLFASAASAQTADDIVKKHIDAVGGADAWKKITSMKMTGSLNGGGMEFPLIIQKLNGKGMRFDVEIQGTKNYSILTSKEGWAFFPISQQQKPEPMTADQVKASQDQLEIGDNLLNAATTGSKVEMLGKEDIDGTDCYKLKVTKKDGQVVTDYVDAKTFYILRQTQKIKADGKDQEVSTTLGNYQKLPEGVVLPMTIESGNGPVTLKKIEVNTLSDESIFKPAKG